MKRTVIIWIGCLFLCISCKENDVLYDTNRVPAFFCRQKKVVPIDALFPAWIIPSSKYFVTVHLNEDYFFKVFSKKDYTLLDSVVTKGRGPGEMLNIGFIDDWEEKEGEMNILSYYPGNQLKACWINIDRSLQEGHGVLVPLLCEGKEFASDLLTKIATIHALSEDSLLLFMSPLPIGLQPKQIVR